MQDDQLSHLVRAAGCRLCGADLGWCKQLSDAALCVLARSCPRLRALRLGWVGQGISDTGILAIAAHCPHIT